MGFLSGRIPGTYYVDDEIAEDVTTLLAYNGDWWYVEDGKLVQ